jgi:hypothetical protein
MTFLDLASGKKTKQVPYAAIKKDTVAFVPAECLPSGTILHDPRNMQLHDILNVLWHCYSCQIESTPELAFQFILFIRPKRQHVLVTNPNDSDEDKGGGQIKSCKECRKQKGKDRATLLDGLWAIDPLPTGIDGQPIAGSLNTDGTQNAIRRVRINMQQMVTLMAMGYQVSAQI